MEQIFNNQLLKNKVVVITGGTKGVGRAITKACVEYGAKVVFTGRDKSSADEIIKSLSNKKENIKFISADLSNIECCEKLFDEAVKCFGKIDCFINYAGITPVASLTDCDEITFNNVMNVNFKAAFFCCQHAIKNMINNGSGSIILIGSAHSWSGQKDRAVYACSKGALYTLSEHISHNYAKDNIRCNFLTLGWTPTEGEVNLRNLS